MLRKTLALCAIGLVIVVSLEVLVRVSGISRHLYTDPGFAVAADGSRWQYRPGYRGRFHGTTDVEIGPFGERRFPAENVDGRLRVAVFGDSITFGQAVGPAEAFSALIEDRLRRRWPDVHVLNFGVQGYTVGMEVAHFAAVRSQIDPAVVVLVFGVDDLNPEREQNRVDRFGYLTKKVFGEPSLAGDLGRAALRQSHLALVIKDAYLRRQSAAQASDGGATGSSDSAPALAAFRQAMRRFDSLTGGRGRVVMCSDLRETALSRELARLMQTEFPHIDYLDSSPKLSATPLTELRVPRDGHPNARAHAVYADLLEPSVARAIESLLQQGAPDAPHAGSR